MKLITRLATLTVTVFALNVNAAGLTERDYTIKDVLEVHVNSGIKLQLNQGESESLKLTSSEDILKYIHVDLTGNKLRLSLDKKFSDLSSWFNTDEVVFTLVVKNLQLIDLSGGVDADVGNLKLDHLFIKTSGGTDSNFLGVIVKDLRIEASGGSDVNLDTVMSEAVNLNVSGGSDIRLKNTGNTNALLINASGGSDCKVKNLESLNAEVIASGASDVDVRATKTLKVNAGGASDVNYYGNPKITSDVSGASDLHAR